MAREITTGRASVRASTRPVISWGAVLGGGVVGLALFALLSSLWLALAYESQTNEIRANLAWFVGGSALVCLFVGGSITGYLSGVRSVTSGILHGWALWGLLLFAAVAIGIPSVLNIFGLTRISSSLDVGLTGSTNALWASFWTILGGFVAGGLGGAIGGSIAREPGITATTETGTDDTEDLRSSRAS